MFNTTIVRPTQVVETPVHHYEHRAPTDKSVELLSEMEHKAEERIISVNRLKNNTLDAIWWVRDNPMNMELVATCKLKINGKEHEFKVDCERPWRKEHAQKVVHGICEQITRELMMMCFSQTRFDTLLTR